MVVRRRLRCLGGGSGGDNDRLLRRARAKKVELDASQPSGPVWFSRSLSLSHSPSPPTSLLHFPPQVAAALASCAPDFAAIDALIAANVRRTQAAFAAARIGPHHFAGSTGYGKGDAGRAALDRLMASLLGTPSAIVRPHFVSGTHAIAAALFGALRPGDTLVTAAGAPYDTLEEVIGLPGRGAPGDGSLAEWGVAYRQVELDAATGGIDHAALAAAVTLSTRVVLVQRSCGYAPRRTLTIAEIGEAVATVRRAAAALGGEAAFKGGRSPVVAVDNCYGEFTEVAEPGAVGADLVMGSLIKAPGGTVAPGGGYVGGRPDLVSAAASRLTAPGIGLDAGAVDGATLRLLFQGLYLAPHTVGEAVKGGRLIAAVAGRAGWGGAGGPASAADPPAGAPGPWPFITAVKCGSASRLVAFCRAVQAASPVGSYVLPEPGATPGYADPVVFGDGTFIDGSTAEASADGPLREPFAAYCQGGSHWSQWVAALEAAVAAFREEE